eukprot:5972690-Prymnesium_polylepis.1
MDDCHARLGYNAQLLRLLVPTLPSRIPSRQPDRTPWLVVGRARLCVRTDVQPAKDGGELLVELGGHLVDTHEVRAAAAVLGGHVVE